MLYQEGATQPKMMSVGLHMRLIGHPARAAGLERLLDYIARHDGVWVTRRVDIAGTGRPRTPTPARASTSSRRRQAGRLAQSSSDIGCRTISSASF